MLMGCFEGLISRGVWLMIFDLLMGISNFCLQVLFPLSGKVEGKGCPRPHIPLSGKGQSKGMPALPPPLFGKGRVVAGFIPALVGDEPRPYGVCFKMSKKQKEGKFEKGCPRPHIPLFGKGRKVEILGCPRPHFPLSGEVEEEYCG